MESLPESDWDETQSISGASISPSIAGFLAGGSKKISDAITFGPKFCELFQTFSTDCELNVDINRHLFALIIDYLVDFVKWVRRDEHQVANVYNLLFNCDYLRPETRNGVIMVIIYLFSSIKSTVIPGADMFSVLVDDDSGLGIANRFSLRIYNDPFFYLTFLKISVSALIDCGAIPENDRMNTMNKSAKPRAENVSETEYFNKIKSEILLVLQENDVAEAKRIIEIICNYCQYHKREIVRGKQFSMMYAKLQAANDERAAQELTAHRSSSRIEPLPIPISTTDSSADVSSAMSDQDELDSSPPSKRPRDSIVFSEEISPSSSSQPSTSILRNQGIPSSVSFSLRSKNMQQTCTLPSYDEFAQSFAKISRIQALRYTRVGRTSWNVSAFAVLDANCLLSLMRENCQYNRTLFLIDSVPTESAILQPNTQYNAKQCMTASVFRGICTLRDVLVAEKVLITDWHIDDAQLLLFWSMLKSVSSRNLPRIWRDELSTSEASEEDMQKERGFLAIEVDERMIICIRCIIDKDPLKSSKQKDLWCHIYQEDLTNVTSNQSIGEFFSGLFPQLLGCLPSSAFPETIVKYKATPLMENGSLPPFDTNSETMETLAILHKGVGDMLCKLSPHQVCHNFVLEVF